MRRLLLERRRQHPDVGDVAHTACPGFVTRVDNASHAFPFVHEHVVTQKVDDDLMTTAKTGVQFAQGIQLFVAVAPGNQYGLAR